MGRIAGVTADETRERLLRGAASVFARKGYDGASIAEIASEAGVSSGAIYGHFGSKAGLFAAALHEHGSREVEQLLTMRESGADALRLLRERGMGLPHRRPEDGSLLVEAIVAAKRHPEVVALLTAAIAEREARIATLIRAGQEEGSVADRIGPDAVSRFVLMLVLGSLLAAAIDLPAVDDHEWGVLIDALTAAITPRPPTT